ncbi:MAG: hypothetical protein RMJ05_00565, partial [Thermomicrobium sp.]|nr:hypothetical protein [Thermomicrobium sp.]MDW8005186.1 hypothetical protein [Thermomicrobium sp.]
MFRQASYHAVLSTEAILSELLPTSCPALNQASYAGNRDVTGRGSRRVGSTRNASADTVRYRRGSGRLRHRKRTDPHTDPYGCHTYDRGHDTGVLADSGNARASGTVT